MPRSRTVAVGCRSVGSGGEVHRACRSRQCALNALYPVRRIARRLDDKGKLAYLLAHRGGQVIVSVGLDGHFLHGSEEPAGGAGDCVAVVPLIVMFSGMLQAARV